MNARFYRGRPVTRQTLLYMALITVWFPVQLLHELHPQIYWLQIALRLLLSVGILCKYSPSLLNLKRDTAGWLVPLVLLLPLQVLAIFRAGFAFQQVIKCMDFLLAGMGSFLFFRQLKDEHLPDLRGALLALSFLYAAATLPLAIANWGSSYQNVLLIIGGRAETVQILFVFSAVLLSLDYHLHGKVTKPVWCAFLLSAILAVLLGSGQGMMMFGLLLCVVLFDRWRTRLWKMINLFWGSLVVFGLNLLILTGLYQKITPITFVIEKVLKKNINLTGRTNIYPQLPEIVADSPLIGFGYASGIVKDRIAHINPAYVNAHNAMAELVILFGILGTVILVGLVLMTLKKNYRHCDLSQHAVLIGAVWICFIGGLVNIMLAQFVFWWLLAFAWDQCGRTRRLKNGGEYEQNELLPNR